MQFWKSILGKVLNTFGFDDGIAMDKQVAKVGDPTPWWNTLDNLGARLFQAVQGFTDDFELALDGSLGSIVAVVDLAVHAPDITGDISGSRFDI